MKKNSKLLILAATALLATSAFAQDKNAIMKDMKAQEEAMATIQKGILYGSIEIVKEGAANLKKANQIATLKEQLSNYLPENKKALYKTAMKEGEEVNKFTQQMLKQLEKKQYGEAMASYGKTLNACNTCHLIIRDWK